MASRIFSVRINLDEIASSLDLCFTDADRSAWLRGFMVGCRGGQVPSGPPPMLDGHRLGLEAHSGAIAHQQRAAEGGKKSAQTHPENLHKGKRPSPAPSESTPESTPDCTSESTSDPPSDQSNNRIIEESRERPIDRTENNNRDEPMARPTRQEVSDYIDAMGYEVDAEKFMAYNDSKGWRVGKAPMKDWRRALTTWHLKTGLPIRKKSDPLPTDPDWDKLPAALRGSKA